MLPTFIADWLIRRALRHPYYHLFRKHQFPRHYMRRFWLLGHGTGRDVDRHGQTFNKPAGRLHCWLAQRLCIRVHEIIDSDRDRDLHDHPSWSVSIVLRGGYWEVKPHPNGSRNPLPGVHTNELTMAYWRKPGAIVFRRANFRHQVVLRTSPYTQMCNSAWSIFILGRRSQKWGFYTKNGKVSHDEYESVHGKGV